MEKARSFMSVLVEQHDVVALSRLIPLDPEMSCNFDYEKFREVKPNNMRDYLRDNKSDVELSCELGYLDITTIFLDNGCSPNLPTSDGRLIHSILYCLKSRRELVTNGEGLKIMKLMVSLQCDFDVKDYDHKSPLMIAAELSDAPIMKLVLENCMDWQLNPTSGFTPLHMACLLGNIDCVRQLVARMTRESLNKKDEKFYTPLLYSLRMLINNFSLHACRAEEEKKLWHMQFKHIAVSEFLLASGASFIPENRQCPREFYGNPVYGMVMLVNDYELVRNYAMLDTYSYCPLQKQLEKLKDTCFISTEGEQDVKPEDEPIEVLEKCKKIISPYAGLMRLIAQMGVDIFDYEDFARWNKINPCMVSFFIELRVLSEKRKLYGMDTVPSLLHLCRRTIRLEAGKHEKLHELENLPLPWKLICYVMFLTI